jgi:hypothetical protein
MNEQIKELLAGVSAGYTFNHWQLTDAQMEKFAELIVRECADICKVIGDAHLNDLEGSPEFGHGAYFAAKQIKDHFGVK